MGIPRLGSRQAKAVGRRIKEVVGETWATASEEGVESVSFFLVGLLFQNQSFLGMMLTSQMTFFLKGKGGMKPLSSFK